MDIREDAHVRGENVSIFFNKFLFLSFLDCRCQESAGSGHGVGLQGKYIQDLLD